MESVLLYYRPPVDDDEPGSFEAVCNAHDAAGASPAEALDKLAAKLAVAGDVTRSLEVDEAVAAGVTTAGEPDEDRDDDRGRGTWG